MSIDPKSGWIASEVVAEEIRVCGTVQGVGFRPTVYRLAQALALRGEVWNDGQGVLIRAVGPSIALDRFITALQQDCPPLATIETLTRTRLTRYPPYSRFTITPSVSNSVRTGIPPDAATCPDCIAETLDPSSRWYRYPFTNCTHCGPRLSIVRSIPYDRHHTSMASFPMCPDCRQEYEEVTNRRFHAQPVACPTCGPTVWLERSQTSSEWREVEQCCLDKSFTVADPPAFSPLMKGGRGDQALTEEYRDLGGNAGVISATLPDAIAAASLLLQQGNILAIKGIGGFHLACDATNEAAVHTLRQRKHRYYKPFALMARDIETIDRYAQVNATERQHLHSPIAPIVLLRPHPATSSPTAPAIAPSVAPGMGTLGFMLPYTPLHHLLLQSLDRPLVMTSGNRSDEPQCLTNVAAREQLSNIADYLLLHDREIINRVDDSVVRVSVPLTSNGQPSMQILRRARGYAPAPIRLPSGFEQAPAILAMGSELKNTIGLLREGQAILSQHLGDLEHAAAFHAYQQTLELYLHLFQHQPEAIAVDHHPDYLSTKQGQDFAAAHHLPLYAIQHHHAHVAACLADNGVPIDAAPVLGIALDGLGYGEEGTLWGGEFLLADYQQFQRLGTFQPIALIGGAQAIRQPWRNTYAHLRHAFSWDDLQSRYGHLELIQFLRQKPCTVLDQMVERGIQSPRASSAGRLFDAVAAAVGICREEATYEGQGAIELEALIQAEDLRQASQSPYRFEVIASEPSSPNALADLYRIDSSSLWRSVLDDLSRSVPVPLIAARFHLGLAQVIAQVIRQFRSQHSFTQVALTGGVFQNQILAQSVAHQLTAEGLFVLQHTHVPANDGGLALGQLAIAAARSLDSGKS